MFKTRKRPSPLQSFAIGMLAGLPQGIEQARQNEAKKIEVENDRKKTLVGDLNRLMGLMQTPGQKAKVFGVIHDLNTGIKTPEDVQVYINDVTSNPSNFEVPKDTPTPEEVKNNQITAFINNFDKVTKDIKNTKVSDDLAQIRSGVISREIPLDVARERLGVIISDESNYESPKVIPDQTDVENEQRGILIGNFKELIRRIKNPDAMDDAILAMSNVSMQKISLDDGQRIFEKISGDSSNYKTPQNQTEVEGRKRTSLVNNLTNLAKVVQTPEMQSEIYQTIGRLNSGDMSVEDALPIYEKIASNPENLIEQPNPVEVEKEKVSTFITNLDKVASRVKNTDKLGEVYHIRSAVAMGTMKPEDGQKGLEEIINDPNSYEEKPEPVDPAQIKKEKTDNLINRLDKLSRVVVPPQAKVYIQQTISDVTLGKISVDQGWERINKITGDLTNFIKKPDKSKLTQAQQHLWDVRVKQYLELYKEILKTRGTLILLPEDEKTITRLNNLEIESKKVVEKLKALIPDFDEKALNEQIDNVNNVVGFGEIQVPEVQSPLQTPPNQEVAPTDTTVQTVPPTQDQVPQELMDKVAKGEYLEGQRVRDTETGIEYIITNGIPVPVGQ